RVRRPTSPPRSAPCRAAPATRAPPAPGTNPAKTLRASLQAVAPGLRRLDRGYVVLKDEMVGWLFEPQSGQPAPVHLRPGWPVVVLPVPQQEAGELLAGLAQGAYRRLTRPHQIAHRLMGLVGDP